jgi:hypothetical protein
MMQWLALAALFHRLLRRRQHHPFASRALTNKLCAESSRKDLEIDKETDKLYYFYMKFECIMTISFKIELECHQMP